jgi:hypothetical protein
MADGHKGVKVTFWQDEPVHAALVKDAKSKRRDIVAHVQSLLVDYVLEAGLLDDKEANRQRLRLSLLQRVAEAAVAIFQNEGVPPDIINRAIADCMTNQGFATDYEIYVGDNPYKHGNPRKEINKEFGRAVKAAVGAKTKRTANGKAVKTPVAGAIIQSYTVLEPADQE